MCENNFETSSTMLSDHGAINSKIKDININNENDLVVESSKDGAKKCKIKNYSFSAKKLADLKSANTEKFDIEKVDTILGLSQKSVYFCIRA